MKKKQNNSTANESATQKARLAEIIQVLYKHKITEEFTKEKFRMILEDLGATFIKIGQIMSMRKDVLPEEYCEELTKLRKETTYLSYKEIKSILKSEYKRPLTEIFSNIDEKPLGSASIAQVHKATLLSGQEVVIKVQKPGIYETMASDISLLKKAFSIIKVPFINDSIDIQGMLDEMWSTAKQELDFLIEADHIVEFERNNREIAYIKTPAIYKDLCKTNIIVMEYIDGIIINDVNSLNENGYVLSEIATKLADAYIMHIIEHGYFHADPHPDNFKILDGKIVFLDFGMMGRLSTRDRNLLKDMMYAIVNQDISKLEKCILTLGTVNNEVDHSDLCNDLDIFLNKYSTLDLANLNLGTALSDLFKITNTYKIRIPKNITLLGRGIVIIEGLLNEISPEIHLLEILKTRVSSNFASEFFSEDAMKNNLKNLYIAQKSLIELPKESLDFIKMASKGNAKFNLEITDSQNKIGKLEKMLNRIILACLDVAFIVSGSLLFTSTAPDNFAITILRIFSLISSFILTIILFILMLRDLKQKG